MVAGLLPLAGCWWGGQEAATGPSAAAPPEQRAEYAGSDICMACHRAATPDVLAKYEQTVMAKVFMHNARTSLEKQNCEACHGPGGNHVAAGGGKGKGVGPGQMITFAKDDPTPAPQRNAKCLACHERRAHLYWKGSPHDRNDVACTNCHVVMERRSAKSALARGNVVEVCGQCHLVKRAQVLTRVEHMPIPEGKISCTDCHNPHGSATPAMLVRDSPNAVCYICHADKRGPFLWEHPPVVETCMNCHNPHGGNREYMLKTIVFRLCQECHDAAHATGPLTAASNRAFNRGCVNCHSRIHGSNHPSGMFFEL
jgi:DmsE family decaheme c-type cytochrome